ncbi:putative DNA modification/repair radical SAM protein [Peptococcaceae bacterium 1198_IL3148]
MDLAEKLKILSDAAKYDVSCSSSGSKRKNTTGGVGNAAASGICHSWTEDGRCVSLLKILFSNCCCYDCAYCVNRTSNDIPRATFTPQEVADLTINFYRRNYIEGLFLSSAIIKNCDYTMEMLLNTVKIIRKVHRFNGYIHLKAIPGADFKLIAEAGKYVDRMSANIELPSDGGLKLLAPQKKQTDILGSMERISERITVYKEDRKLTNKTVPFVPAGQSTQLIVGATPDHDLKILQLSENLYRNYQLKRVYYSAYVPVSNDPKLPMLKAPPLVRENRLYQADWLLRFYGFSAQELLDNNNPNFDLQLDPKSNWALRNLHLFPLEVNRVDYELLLRVPGIGVISAKRIVAARRFAALSYEDLKKIGVVLKRARYFITCRGKYYGEVPFKEHTIRQRIISPQPSVEQLTMFDGLGYKN